MDKDLCLALYREAFPEPDLTFEEALFKYCFKYCHYIKENDKVISMLFALPCKFVSANEKCDCVYIYAAATLREYRGKGYMARLMEKVKNENDFLFLRPANSSLIAFYEKIGFKTVNAQKSKELPCITPDEQFAELLKYFPEDENEEEYTAMYICENKSLSKLNFIYTME